MKVNVLNFETKIYENINKIARRNITINRLSIVSESSIVYVVKPPRFNHFNVAYDDNYNICSLNG